MNPGLLKSWRRKNNLWKAFKSAKSLLNVDLQQFKLYRNVFSSLSRKARILYIPKNSLDCGKDVLKTWQVINFVLKRSCLAPFIPSSLSLPNLSLLSLQLVEGVPSVQEAFTSYFSILAKLLLLQSGLCSHNQITNLLLVCLVSN